MLYFVRSLQPSAWIAAVLVVTATVAAVINGRVTSLLIGAAMVASTVAVISYQVDRRLGDAHDTGKSTERGAILRAMKEMARD